MRQYRPHRDGPAFVPGGGEQADGGMANAHVRRARRTVSLTRHLQDLDAVRRPGLHRFPQALLLVAQLAVMFRAHQQLGPFGVRHGLCKQLVDIRLAVAHADQRGAGAARLDSRHCTEALQPLEAFFLLDRNTMTLRLLAEVSRIARPALHIQKPQRRALGAEGECRV